MEAYITLLTNNNYASGALVLAHSLRASQSTKQLAVLITAAVSRPIRDRLATVFDSVIEIGEIDSRSTKNLALLGRPELGITLTKIHVFNQTQYSKVVFLDADTLVLRNIDDLFDTAANGSLDDEDRNKRFAASPDAGWPDCFNSGVFVCKPCFKDYTGLIQMASQEGTFDGGDQGLLNSYFSGWSRGEASNRLPFIYNTTPTASYSYAPAYQQYRDRLAVVHFIGNFKPWQWLRFADGAVFPRNTSSKDSIDLVQQWWNVFDNFVGGKPSDIHDVVHGYDLPPVSQWDHVGLDGQPHELETEKRPHYDGWFQAYDHQNQAQQPPQEGHPDQWQPPIPPSLGDRIEWLHEQHHHHQHHDQKHHQYHEHHQNHEHHHQQEHHQHEHHVHHGHYEHGQNGHHEHHHHGHHEQHQNGHHDYHHHHHGHQEQHQHEHHEHKHEHHQHHEHHDHHEHHQQHHHQEPAVPQPPIHHETHYAYNPHHLTDYHYQPPPLPPVVPLLPEPESQSWGPNETVNGVDERQTQHKRTSSTTSVDREANPHHLTDYRYRLPPAVDSSDVANGAAKFGAIIPEPVGLPDMYYPNAWDLPEDPRKAHPTLEHTPLPIENTTNDDNTSVPSGKGRPIFPWEAGGSVASTSRTPTRKYYNYAASAEERKRQHDLEVTRRLEIEEEALKQIRLQEHARYERDRLKEEAHEQVTGSQAFENFRLVNAWDVDVGVQMSILQKTEKRRPRSRKSSAGGFRKGYGLEDMLAYEARQRQEQFEAELIQQRLDEEERWQKEQEEARIKEEELRLEKLRLAKIAKIRAQERLRKQEESSTYVFRNAWDPPNIGVTKKKLRIEDEDIEFALPLRQDRKSGGSMTFGWGSTTSAPTREETVARAGGVAVAAGGAAAAAGIALAARSRAFQGSEESDKVTEVSGRTASSSRSGATVIKMEAATSSTDTDTRASRAAETTSSSISTTREGASSTKKTTASQGVISSTTTKITAPGTHRFVRTTVNTTITHRKFANGVEVSSTTTSNTTGGEKMFEIPAGPRSGSYFVGQGRRTESVSHSQEASRLSGTTTTRATTATNSTANKTITQRAITSGHTSETKMTHTEGDESSLVEGNLSTLAEGHKSIHTEGQKSAHGTHIVGSVLAPVSVYQTGQQVTTAAATTSGSIRTTATTTSAKSALQGSGHLVVPDLTSSTSHSGSSGSTFRTDVVEEPRKLTGLALQINTGSPTKERRVEEEWALEYEERQRINDLREKNASAAAAAEAMQVLDRYPQATDRFATRRRADSTSSTKSIGGGGALYANDPHAYSSAFRSSAAREKSIKTSRARSDASGDEDDNVYQEDLDGLEYFGTKHTRGALPLGSPYMPSTPLAGSSQRYSAYSASASGFSSRAGSRPTTPGPSTPSRFGPGTPKLSSKRAFDLKQGTIKGLQQPQTQLEQQQSGMGDFSNYRIEWNWKELLGKKPRHWSAEAGEEYYDPYNALSTHGSLIDSDEDDHILQSSDEDSEEEEEAALRAQQQKKSERAEGGGFSRSSSSNSLRGSGAFATGADNDFTRESEFVIRGGKIARRRSSMVLDRELL